MVMKKKQQPSLEVELKTEEVTFFDSGWRKFSIVYKSDILADGDKAYGMVDFDMGVITIDNTLDFDGQKETLVHEITHIILETVGLGGGHKEEDVEIGNEDLTLLISRGFLLAANLNRTLFGVLFTQDFSE